MQTFLLSPEMFVGKLHRGYGKLLGLDVCTEGKEEWVLTAEKQDEGSKNAHMPRTDEEQAMIVQPVKRERIDKTTKIRYCLWCQEKIQ